MHDALTKLGNLPEDTLVYNGHEYTTGSAKFGLHIEPNNEDIKRCVQLISNCSDEADPRLLSAGEHKDCTTGQSTIGDEKKWNVFMRLDTPEAQ